MRQTNLNIKLREKFIKQGVKMIAPETVFFSKDTKIGKNVIIEPYVVFGKKVKIKNFDKPESWLKRRLSSNLSNDIINISYELESRYLWNKYGL